MFERRLRGVVARSLAGSIAEPQFLQESRPWPRYATDYRGLIEMAKGEGWTGVAANLPRRVASAVAKAGEPAIEQLPAVDRAMMAAELECPHDAYFTRFAEAMTEHTPSESTSTSPAPGGTRGQRCPGSNGEARSRRAFHGRLSQRFRRRHGRADSQAPPGPESGNRF